MIVRTGQQVDLNLIDKSLTDIMLGVSYHLDLPPSIDPSNYIIDPALLLIEKDGQVTNPEQNLVYYNNILLTHQGFSAVEYITNPDHEILNEPKHDEQQFLISLQEIPPKINKILLLMGLYTNRNPQQPDTAYDLSHMKSFGTRILKAGSSRPEEVLTYQMSNYFQREQTVIVAELEKINNIWTFTPDPRAYMGNIVSIYKLYERKANPTTTSTP